MFGEIAFPHLPLTNAIASPLIPLPSPKSLSMGPRANRGRLVDSLGCCCCLLRDLLRELPCSALPIRIFCGGLSAFSSYTHHIKIIAIMSDRNQNDKRRPRLDDIPNREQNRTHRTPHYPLIESPTGPRVAPPARPNPWAAVRANIDTCISSIPNTYASNNGTSVGGSAVSIAADVQNDSTTQNPRQTTAEKKPKTSVDDVMKMPHPIKPNSISRSFWQTLSKSDKQRYSDSWDDATQELKDQTSAQDLRDAHGSSSPRPDSPVFIPPGWPLSQGRSDERSVELEPDISGDDEMQETVHSSVDWNVHHSAFHDRTRACIDKDTIHTEDEVKALSHASKIFATMKINNPDSLKPWTEAIVGCTDKLITTHNNSVKMVELIMPAINRIKEVAQCLEGFSFHDTLRKAVGDEMKETLDFLKRAGDQHHEAVAYYAKKFTENDLFTSIRRMVDQHLGVQRKAMDKQAKRHNKELTDMIDAAQKLIQQTETMSKDNKSLNSTVHDLSSTVDGLHATIDDMGATLKKACATINAQAVVINRQAALQAQQDHKHNRAILLILQSDFDPDKYGGNKEWFEVYKFVPPPPVLRHNRLNASNESSTRPREAQDLNDEAESQRDSTSVHRQNQTDHSAGRSGSSGSGNRSRGTTTRSRGRAGISRGSSRGVGGAGRGSGRGSSNN